MLRLRMQPRNRTYAPISAPISASRAGPKSLQAFAHPESLQCGVHFSLRDFHSSDFQSLWRIDQQCFAPGISYSEAELAEYMNVPGSFTIVAHATSEPAEEVADDQSQILGFVVAHLNRTRLGHIITIDVLPKAQRLGVGSALLKAAEHRLTRSGCRLIRLEAAINNTSALRFYKRHNYFVLKTIPAYYPGGLDALVLKKDLLSGQGDR